MTVRVGDRAPDFEAKLSDGTSFSLSNRRGVRNVILYFYPKDFTSGCTAEACAFRDNQQEFGELDAEVVGVSRDAETSHSRFITAHGLNFPLISDTDGRLARLYGVQRLGGRVATHRTTFVIDRAGTVIKVIHKEIKAKDHVPLALRALREAVSERTA